MPMNGGEDNRTSDIEMQVFKSSTMNANEKTRDDNKPKGA